jgi:hypothetical protein
MNIKEIKFHSQWGQDEFVFNVLKGKKKGFFVDIGAYDGVTISNTYFFEKYLEWDGICVEPNPSTFETLISNRKCQCIRKGIAPYNREVELLLNGWSSAIDDNFTSSEILKEGHNSVIIEAVTINDLFLTHSVPRIFDYLSIDIEGGEMEVIKTLNFDKWRFDILTYEHNTHLINHENYQKMIETKKEMERFLSGKGYEHIKDYEGDGFFLHNSLI